MIIKPLVLIAALAIPSLSLADDAAKGTTTSDKSDTTGKAKSAKLSADDKKIVSHLHSLHMMEIDAGKLAQKNGGDAVKRYGQTLVSDHQAADKQLAAMAKKKGVAKIPMAKPVTEAERMEQQDHKSAVAKLKKLSGAEFDRQFLALMVMDHDREVTRAEAAITTAKDPELQAHLRELKPVLQRHADSARELQKGGAQAIAPSSPGAGTKTGPSAK